MRLILLFAFQLLFTTCLFAQDCSDPNCKSIHELLLSISKANRDIESERVESRKIYRQLQSERQKNTQNQQELNRLSDIFNSQQERINQLISDLNTKQRELAFKIEHINTLNNKTIELQKLISDYEAEKAVYEDDFAIKKAKDLEVLSYMNSFLREVELGYETNSTIIIHKVYDGERVDFSDKRLFKSELLKINIKGDYYINVPYAQVPNDEIKVKVVIFVDNKLHDVIANSLELVKDEGYETIAHYKVKNQIGNSLNKSIPEKSGMIRVGFIDVSKYRSINKDELSAFWEAKAKGHFLITSIEPKLSNVKLTDNEMIRNAMRVDSYICTQESVTVDIFDYGIFDGDQASFYLNGEPIVTFLKLGKQDNPWTMNILLKPGKNHLAIFANNTGTMEPCTASVIIRDGNKVLKRCKLAAKVGYCEKIEIVR